MARLDRTPEQRPHRLARRLGVFDATMIVMGGIIGSGIFVNPYVVARQVHTFASDPGRVDARAASRLWPERSSMRNWRRSGRI